MIKRFVCFPYDRIITCNTLAQIRDMFARRFVHHRFFGDFPVLLGQGQGWSGRKAAR